MGNKELNKNERKILYNFLEKKAMIVAHSFTFGYFLTKYKTEFDEIDIKNILNSLIEKGYIAEKNQKYYGIPNIEKLKAIEYIFKFRNCLDKIKYFLFQILKFIWKFLLSRLRK